MQVMAGGGYAGDGGGMQVMAGGGYAGDGGGVCR